MSFRTNAMKVQAFAGAMYGIQVGTTTMAQVNADITSAGGLSNALNGYYTSSFGSVANATVATTVATNLGLTGDALASGAAYITAQLNAAAPAARGAVISDILDLFAGLASDATFGAAATAWNAKVDTATAYTGSTNIAVDATPPVETGTIFTLTITASETVNGTAASENFVGVISATASSLTMNATDVIVDSSRTDSDTLTLTTDADVTASNTASVRNVEKVIVNVDATVLAGGTTAGFDFAATNFANVTEYQFDVVKPVSAIRAMAATALANGDIVTLSDDFTTANLTVGTVGDNLVVNANAVGTTGTPVAVTIAAGTAAGDVKVTGAGNLSVTSTASTGVLEATAAKGLTVSGAAATVQMLTAQDGNLTVSDASATIVGTYTASGNVSVTDLAVNASLNVTAGGTITLAAGTGSIATTSATLSGTGTSTSGAASTLTSLNISGNGAAATYDFTAGAAELADVTVTGSQNVTLQVAANSIETTSAVLSIADETTAGTLTLEIKGTAGNVDLKGGSLIDRLELDINNADKTLTVKSGQVVALTIDQTSGTPGTTDNTIAVGTSAAVASNTVTILLDDEARTTTAAVDLDGVTVTQAKTITIDGSIDATSTGAAVSHTIDTFEALATNQVVNINMGANNLVLDGTSSVGTTGTITITGSGTITDLTSAITANTIDASAVTGAVTLDATVTADTIKTGSGNDSVTLTTATTGGTFHLGAGTDSLTLDDSSLSGQIVDIDLGDGSDTLIFAAGTKLITGSAGSIALAGVENITFASGSNQEIQASLLSGKTYSVKASAAGNTSSVAVVVAATDTVVNLATLAGSTAAASTVAGMTFVTNASANSAAVAITGMDEAANTITGSAVLGDVLTGGDKADTFAVTGDDKLFDSAGLMQDTFAGGASAASTYDQILLGTTGTAVTVVATDNWSTISGVEQLAASTNDQVISLTLGASAETAGISRITLAADADSTGSNVVSVAAYTETGVTIVGSAGVDTITGGAGADSITGGAGADVLAGGAGNDTFVYASIIDLFAAAASDALVDTSIAGGAGTDTITINVAPTTAATETLDATDPWTAITGVEILKTTGVSADAISITPGAGATTSGIHTIDISSDTTVTGANVIDASNMTAAVTIIGGSGVETITGTASADTITGGAGADVITGGSGNDTYVFASTAELNGTDQIVWGSAATGDIFDFTGFFGSGVASAIDVNGVGTAGLGSFTTSSADDTSIANKVAIFLNSADHTGGSTTSKAAVLTATELLAEITGTGNAFALTDGKAVVVAIEKDTDAADGVSPTVTYYANIFVIDSTLDGLAGVSVNDIKLMGTIGGASDAVTTTEITFAAANFGL